MKKCAIIVGSKGQDGRLLSKLLSDKCYDVYGVDRSFDYSQKNIESLLQDLRPAEIYYLAAHHHSAESLPESDQAIYSLSYKINVENLDYFLTAMTKHVSCKLFYASSSHIFAAKLTGLQDELTPKETNSAYAKTKVMGMDLCHKARTNGQFASVGILYNHESPYRRSQFVSRKITQGVASIYHKKTHHLQLGNLDATVDWTYAGDVVDGMWQILQLNTPDEFILCSSVERSVRDFVREAFKCIGLDYREYVSESENIIRKEHQRRIGSYQKLHQSSGWKPKTTFEDMVAMMVKHDIENLK